MDHILYSSLYINHSRSAIDEFMASRPSLAAESVRALIDTKQYHPMLDLLEEIAEGPEDPYSDPEYYPRYTTSEKFRRIVINQMGKAGAAALVYPTTQVQSPRRDDLNAGQWKTLEFPTNTLIGAQTWMPAISVPAGFTPGGCAGWHGDPGLALPRGRPAGARLFIRAGDAAPPGAGLIAGARLTDTALPHAPERVATRRASTSSASAPTMIEPLMMS